jgi:hypothetical protein
VGNHKDLQLEVCESWAAWVQEGEEEEEEKHMGVHQVYTNWNSQEMAVAAALLGACNCSPSLHNFRLHHASFPFSSQFMQKQQEPKVMMMENKNSHTKKNQKNLNKN